MRHTALQATPVAISRVNITFFEILRTHTILLGSKGDFALSDWFPDVSLLLLSAFHHYAGTDKVISREF